MYKTERFEYLSANREHNIKAYLYIPENSPRGIIQISHGMNEYMGRYDEVIEFLCGKGFIVCGNDHAGHGDSFNKIKGYFGKEKGGETLVQDIHQVYLHTHKLYPDLPYFLLGHSMGSFIARKYMENYSQNLQAVLLSGTGNMDFPLNILYNTGFFLSSIMVKVKGPDARGKFFGFLSFLLFKKNFRFSEAGGSWQTRDPQKTAEFLNDKKCRFTFTYGGYRDILLLIKDVTRKGRTYENKNLPIYIFSGENDPVGYFGKAHKNIAGDFKKAGIENVTVKLYEGGRHEMLNEINRAEVFEDVYKFLDGVLRS